MKSITVEEVNKAVRALTEAKLDKQLYAQIAEKAKHLIGADYAKFFLFDKDRLKKTYYSDELIKQTSFIAAKHFNKILSANNILHLNTTEIHKLHIKHFPREVKSLVVVPLLHSQQLLGYIFLYMLQDKKQLSKDDYALLTLYSQAVSLTLNKEQLQEESQKALEIRDRFISLASHELRTPLTSIHGYIQLLHSRIKDKETLESRWTRELYVESIRLTTLVKELLDVNRIKQGQFAFVFSEVSLQEVIKKAIDRYQLTNATHVFVFQCRLTDHQTRVVGDFDKLVEMVSGLLGNAVKFSKPGEKIVVNLKNIPGMLSLEVKDQGKGISKQDMTAILTGFYKPQYASYIEGMGVGLMLANHIIENHRGKLIIRSKEDKGTTVIVNLPTIKSTR